jgi:Arc/MetJ family transcription regulator
VRTALNLDDDVFQAVRSYAESRALSLSEAVCELVRKGLRSPMHTRMMNGIHVIELPPDSPQITSRRVKELESELE